MAKLLWSLLTVVLTVVTAACSPGGPVEPSAGQGSASNTPAGASADQATPPAEAGGSGDQSAPTSVEVSAVGDVIMGATPELPPDDGRHLFDAVAEELTGDVVLANLDQALTDIATSTKCGATSSACFAFRTPPSYAQRLREAGFTVI